VSLKYNSLSRRLFLQGLGSTGTYISFGLPLLPSLLPSKAAADAILIPPRFIGISSQNGPPLSTDWFPSALPTAKELPLFPAAGVGHRYFAPPHSVWSGPINYSATNGISTLFDQKFNPLVSKMNFLKGLDWPYPDGNHVGGPPLGNIRASTGNLSFLDHFPTIDHIMAYANGFYPNGGAGYVRSVVLNPSNNFGCSFGFANPIQRTGAVNPLPSIYDPKVLFTTMFGTAGPVDPAKPKATPFVDAVLAGFNRVRNGRAISSEDKMLLDAHVDLFADLERNLNATPPVSLAACTSPTAPESRIAINLNMTDSEIKKTYALMNDTLILAMKCQRTRVATYYINTIPGFEGLGGSGVDNKWHWASHAQTSGATADEVAQGTAWIKSVYKWISDNVLYDLVNKMNSITEANGKTMLDNSLVQYSAAAMDHAHAHKNVPLLLFGSANGALNTGLFCDYQNRAVDPTLYSVTGLMMNQYLVTAMQAVGLTPTDYSMTNLGLLFGRYPTGQASYGESLEYSGDISFLAKNTDRYKGPRTTIANKLPFIA
jgi:hypothetical protein